MALQSPFLLPGFEMTILNLQGGLGEGATQFAEALPPSTLLRTQSSRAIQTGQEIL